MIWGASNEYPQYSRLALSRSRLSRITAYLELKIFSVFKQEALQQVTKYCGKEEKFGAILPLFHNIFRIHLISGVKLHIDLWNVVYFFPQFCESDMSRYWYLEVFQIVPWTSRIQESTVCFLEEIRKMFSWYLLLPELYLNDTCWLPKPGCIFLLAHAPVSDELLSEVHLQVFVWKTTF